MRAVDTNVLVRLLTGDDDRQVREADAYVERGAWVPYLALAEASWVLDSIYGFPASRIALAVEALLNHQALVIQDPDSVEAALSQFERKPAVGFTDCLMLEIARRAGHLPLGTSDKALAKLPGAERLRE